MSFEAVAERSTRDRVSLIRIVERRFAGETICTIEGPETRVVTDNGLTAGDLAGLIVGAPKLVNALREAAANIGQPMHPADALRLRSEWSVLLGTLSAVTL
ncbi:hypothetical protein [Nevskia ramosa]|uniref:hypothetical protein n=1 Tax=Nevskia ramosa TaxID=64002 RepID=UPI0012EBA873|nr:hypothetical protein [Nevskia ramosa]